VDRWTLDDRSVPVEPEAMTRAIGSHDVRSDQAAKALAALPHGGREAIVLRVQCAKNHHVAKVYDTAQGLVYAAPVRARSHGDYDLPDQPHGDHAPHRWLDLLEEPGDASDDSLPAWCDCGHRVLSRAEVRAWLDAGEHRVIVD
jgi:hypothetical protein